jgi:hypothetical protein
LPLPTSSSPYYKPLKTSQTEIMSGIPVYTSSPINAAKASGRTPKTETVPSQTAPAGPAPAPATTTTSAASSYPPAQPGAAAMPAPTGTFQRYTPLQPTPTTTSDRADPPPPQPGAIPTTPYQKVAPPPKAGERYNPPAQPYPPQMAVPPPTSAYGAHPPSSSTSTTTAPTSAYPVPLSFAEQGKPRGSIEHPPGYHQNTFASELSRDQRQANESSNSEGRSEGLGSFDSGSALNTAKQWLSAAGNKLSEAEQEVWRRIGKE